MIGLEPFRPDLRDHDAIVEVIEPAVKKFTVQELEDLNANHRQAGVEAMKHEDFINTPHVRSHFHVPTKAYQIDLGSYQCKPTPLDHHVYRKRVTPCITTPFIIREA
jgi:hypothetical protein